MANTNIRIQFYASRSAETPELLFFVAGKRKILNSFCKVVAEWLWLQEDFLKFLVVVFGFGSDFFGNRSGPEALSDEKI